MPWLKVGDSAANDPRFLAVCGIEGADDRTLNEVRGFVFTLATSSAAHMTDYVVNFGVVVQAAGGTGNALRLVEMCTAAGLLERCTDPQGLPAVRIVEDPDFLHIRSRKEIEWERTRRNDNRDPNLKFPVILRDGDTCRWCGKEVYWTGKTGPRKGTIDHLIPGEAGTLDTLVVSCLRCNGTRSDDETGSWDHAHSLLPVPTRPRYGKWSRAQLIERGLLSEEDAALSASPTSGERPETPSTDIAPYVSISDVDPAEADHLERVEPSDDSEGVGLTPATPPGGVREYRPLECDLQRSDSASTPPRLAQSRSPDCAVAGSGRDWDGDGQGKEGKERRGDGLGGSPPSSDSPGRRRRKRRSHKDRKESVSSE